MNPSLCTEEALEANGQKLVQLTSPARPATQSPVTSAETAKSPAVIPPKAYVLHYSKEGAARFLSHLNVMRLMEQAMIRAGLRLRFTEGFNPHPKFATSPAIPLGMASQFEYIQFEHHGGLPEGAVEQMNACLVDGLSVRSVVPFESKDKWSVTQPVQVS